MNFSKRIFAVLTLIAASAFVCGCGSITFFPSAPAQKAADNIIDEVWPASQPTVPVITVGGGKETAPAPVVTPK